MSGRDYLVPGDFDEVLKTAKENLAGWTHEMVGTGRVGTEYVATMDQQFRTEMRAVKIYRKPEGRMTRVRVWQRHPPLTKIR